MEYLSYKFLLLIYVEENDQEVLIFEQPVNLRGKGTGTSSGGDSYILPDLEIITRNGFPIG